MSLGVLFPGQGSQYVGMGADLFESYCGSLLAACALGAAAWVHEPQLQLKVVIAPLLISGLGIMLSIVGVFLVTTREEASQADLLKSLSRGINASAALIIICSAGLLFWLGIFAIALRVLTYFKGIEEIGVVLGYKLLSMILIVSFALLIFSSKTKRLIVHIN